MTRVAPSIPPEQALLCEHCGYVLSGLDDSSNCPECGTPIRESSEAGRELSHWEKIGGFEGFAKTEARVLLTPGGFYKKLITRADSASAKTFAKVNWLIGSLFIGTAAFNHFQWFTELGGTRSLELPGGLGLLVLFTLLFGTYLFVSNITAIASRLTHWEASYRGLRMPLAVVRRGLYFHSAALVPVGLFAFVTVIGYRLLLERQIAGLESASTYLIVLCSEVVLSAVYLFVAYWAGMRNMMYASK